MAKNNKSNKKTAKPKKQNKNSDSQAIKKLEAKLRGMEVSTSQPTTFMGKLGKSLQMVGGGLGSFSKIWGLGAYRMTNSCFDVTSQQVPYMHSSIDGFTVRHREYLGDVLGNNSILSWTNYSINPGLSLTFPYLSGIACNFAEYKWKGLVFEYKTTCATAVANGTNPSMGTVSMAANYRADAPHPVSRQQILNSFWCADGVVYENLILPIECDPKENPMEVQYVRTGPVPTGSDEKLYDLGNVDILLCNNPSTNAVGELWVSYEIEFFKPVQSTTKIAGYAHYTAGNYSDASPFQAGTTSVRDTIGLSFSNNAIIFPQNFTGTIMIHLTCFGTSTTVTTGTMTPSGGFATNSIILLAGGGFGASISNGGSTTTTYSQTSSWNVENPVGRIPTITLTGYTFPTTGTAINVFVYMIPNDGATD